MNKYILFSLPILFILGISLLISQVPSRIFITGITLDENKDKILTLNIEHPQFITFRNINYTLNILSPTNSNYYFIGKIYDYHSPDEMEHFWDYIKSYTDNLFMW